MCTSPVASPCVQNYQHLHVKYCVCLRAVQINAVHKQPSCKITDDDNEHFNSTVQRFSTISSVNCPCQNSLPSALPLLSPPSSFAWTVHPALHALPLYTGLSPVLDICKHLCPIHRVAFATRSPFSCRVEILGHNGFIMWSCSHGDSFHYKWMSQPTWPIGPCRPHSANTFGNEQE